MEASRRSVCIFLNDWQTAAGGVQMTGALLASGGTMTAEVSERGAFVPYPTNCVVGTIHTAGEAQATIKGLLASGFERDDVDVLHDEGDLLRLNEADEGFLAQFQRTLTRTGSTEENAQLQRHLDDVRAGKFVILVRAKARDRRDLAASILHSHGATSVGFYGLWTWEALEGNKGAPDPAPGRTYEATIGDAKTRVAYTSPTAATVIINGEAASRQATVTPARPGVSILSWQDAKNGPTVQVHDYETGAVYAVLPDPEGGLRHLAGTLHRVD